MRATHPFPRPIQRRRKRAVSCDSGSPRPIVMTLAGGIRDPTTVCGDGRWTRAMDCMGRTVLSEGPLSRRVAAAMRRGQWSPPQSSPFEYP